LIFVNSGSGRGEEQQEKDLAGFRSV